MVSILSHTKSENFPCTWGTFTTVALLIARLPPGLQFSVRDVAEAYRTIPAIHYSGWVWSFVYKKRTSLQSTSVTTSAYLWPEAYMEHWAMTAQIPYGATELAPCQNGSMTTSFPGPLISTSLPTISAAPNGARRYTRCTGKKIMISARYCLKKNCDFLRRTWDQVFLQHHDLFTMSQL